MEYIGGRNSTIKVTDEGYTVIVVIVKDKAGNVSTPITVKLKKDSEKPLDFIPGITNEKAKGFTINAGTADETSGIEEYRYYVGGELKGKTSEERLEVTGLESSRTYAVYVEAVDKAGNIKKSTSIPGTTKGDLQKPEINISSGTEGNNGYYKTNVTVEIRDSADEETTGATKIKYKINNGAEQTINGRTGTYTITGDGETTITAYTMDDSGNKSTEAKRTIKKDGTVPNTATLSVSSCDITTISVTANGQDATSRNIKICILLQNK